MAHRSISRRSVLQLGAASIAFAGMSGIARAQAEAIVVSWFGGNARGDLFNRVIDLYEAEKGVRVGREYAPFGDYHLRLSTQAAAGQMPDIVNFHYGHMRGYADRGLLALDDLVASKSLDLSTFAQPVLDAGKVNGRLYGVNIGYSGPCVFINERIFADAGVAPPDGDWDWAQFEEVVIDLSSRLPADTYAFVDSSKNENLFEVFLRSLGGTVFDDVGHIAFTPEHLTKWLSIWDRLRKAGAIPDAATAAQDVSSPGPQTLFARGMAAMMSTNANQLHIWQEFQASARNDLLDITFVPDGRKPGVSALISALFGIAANTRDVARSADFLNWWVNSREMAELYLNEHGVLGNGELQAEITPSLPPPMQRTVAWVSEMVTVGKPFTPHPTNGRDIMSLWASKTDNASFDMSTPEQASAEFFAEVASIAQLARS